MTRGTETEHSIEERITKAVSELTFAPRFDHIIINDNLDIATKELMRLVDEFTGC
jgi:guanylate kinase